MKSERQYRRLTPRAAPLQHVSRFVGRQEEMQALLDVAMGSKAPGAVLISGPQARSLLPPALSLHAFLCGGVFRKLCWRLRPQLLDKAPENANAKISRLLGERCLKSDRAI